jgi:hypothetical protein
MYVRVEVTHKNASMVKHAVSIYVCAYCDYTQEYKHGEACSVCMCLLVLHINMYASSHGVNNKCMYMYAYVYICMYVCTCIYMYVSVDVQRHICRVLL